MPASQPALAPLPEPAAPPPPARRATLGALSGPARRSDGLSAGQLRAVVVAIGLLHVAAIWGALQVPAVREAVLQTAPMFVDLLQPPAPDTPPAPPPPPLQPAPPKLAPPPTVIAAAPSPAPAAFEVQAPPELPPPPPPVSEPPRMQAPPAPPAPPPPPRFLPASLVQYLQTPSPVYPLLSRRQRETGITQLLVFIDEHGLPAMLQVKVSSGSPRLDDAALVAVKKWRFKPPTENGQPVAGWAEVPIAFELE